LKTQPLPTVDAQILFHEFEPMDSQELEATIVMAATAMGIPEQDCRLLDNSTQADKRFLCGNFHVLVTQSIPFENSSHLTVALNTFSVRSTFPEAADMVGTARHCIGISIRKSLVSADVLPATAHELVVSDGTAFSDSSETRTAMEMVRIIAGLVVEKTRPDAVFWFPSVFLLMPETFLDCCKAGNQNFLYMQPDIYEQEDPDTGEQLVGVIGVGSPWLIGYTIEIKPCALPPDYLVEVLFAFLSFTQKSEKLIADHVFGRDNNERIQVLVQEETEGLPASIELKVVHNPALGIVREEVPVINKHHDDDCKVTDESIGGGENTALNPDDPVDAAILEQLRALKKDASTTGSDIGEAENERAFQELDPPAQPAAKESVPEAPEFSRRPSSPAPPQSKRVSMSELRRIAQQAQASAEDADTPPRRRGLLGKLFGRKSH